MGGTDHDQPAVLADVEGPERVARLAARAEAAVVFDRDRIPVIKTGETSAAATLTRARLEELLRAALMLSDEHASHVWVEGDSELAIHADRTRVALAPGILLVGIAVECDQTGPAEVTFPFRTSGMTKEATRNGAARTPAPRRQAMPSQTNVMMWKIA